MAQEFYGTKDHVLDPKGRVTVPSSIHRAICEGDPDFVAPEQETDDEARARNKSAKRGKARYRLVWANEGKDCVKGYSITEIRDIAGKIAAMPRNSPVRQQLERHYFAESDEFEVDANGRTGLPQNVRKMLGLTDKVMFVGAMGSFEIWKPEVYEAYKAKMDEEAKDLSYLDAI